MGFQITYEDFITITMKHQFVYQKDEGGPNNWGQIDSLYASDGLVGDDF